MHALDILSTTVLLTVGDKAEPRPGQVSLTRLASEALDKRKHAAAVAPTGSGKSYSLLSPALERVVHHGERVMLSTESLTLQKQIVDKDFPRAAAAVMELYGREVTCAVLKGTGNYVDPRQLTATAALITGESDTKRKLSEWQQLVYQAGKRTPSPDIVQALDGADFKLLAQLVNWCFSQYDDDNAVGDRHSCKLKVTEAEWRMVSASSAEACGPEDHWLFPKAILAKEAAAHADVVIVNHTLLAIQAARGLPIVLGTAKYGEFQHLLIDEAHTLPDEVRKQGAAVVSGGVMMSLAYKVDRLAVNAGRWKSEGEILADALDRELRGFLGRERQKKVEKDDDPLGDVGLMVGKWLDDAAKLVKPASESPAIMTKLDGIRTLGRIDELKAAVKGVSEHRAGDARWVEVPDDARCSNRRSWASANASPVNVGQKLLNNLYVVDDPEDPEVRHELGVVAVSATLPDGFAFQAGLAAQVVEYDSPFEDAYRESALFIPNGVPHAAKLLSTRYGSSKFDTTLHQPWAAEMARRFIEANGGSALFLAATASAGKFYTEQLRRQFPMLDIYSQWDGPTATSEVDAWKANPSSVLVGTRSLMTGLDAPGETNSLLLLDRIPRKPSNANDDARVEDLMARGLDEHTSSRIVYAGDAALLEAQAVGRLIRAASDRGLVAILDPRLLRYKQRAFPGYPEPTRQVYMKPLRAFGVKLGHEEDALAWLRARRGASALVTA